MFSLTAARTMPEIDDVEKHTLPQAAAVCGTHIHKISRSVHLTIAFCMHGLCVLLVCLLQPNWPPDMLCEY